MAIKMRYGKMTLNFKEEKPQVYCLRQLKWPTIKEKDLMKYIANSSNVPMSTVEACVAAIAEAIVYFAINGHRVVFPDFGGFYINVRTKSKTSLPEVTVEGCVESTRLAFAPCTELRELISDTNTTIVTGAIYSLPEQG